VTLEGKENPSFDNGFVDFYNGNGKKAGTYVFRGGGWGSSNEK
jgi:hypothetical protein